MRFKTDTLDVEVKYKKMKSSLIVPTPPIVLKVDDKPVEKLRVVTDKRFLWLGKGAELVAETKYVDPKTKKEVPESEVLEVLEHYGYRVLDAKAKEIDKEEQEIRYFVVEEGDKYREVRPFERTKVLEIPEENWVPSTVLDDYILEPNWYELFHPKKLIAMKLYEEAEKRLRKDQVGLCTFSWGGGFKQFYAFVIPTMLKGQFVWLLKFTQNKVEYQYLQDIPAEGQLPIREEAPTLDSLVPVQALVMAVKASKK